MSKRRDSIADTVVSAVNGAATADRSAQPTRGSEILQQLDSLELMMALAEIQGILGLKFEPEHLLELFMCQSLEEMVGVVEVIARGAKTDANVDSQRAQGDCVWSQ